MTLTVHTSSSRQFFQDTQTIYRLSSSAYHLHQPFQRHLDCSNIIIFVSLCHSTKTVCISLSAFPKTLKTVYTQLFKSDFSKTQDTQIVQTLFPPVFPIQDTQNVHISLSSSVFKKTLKLSINQYLHQYSPF